MSDNDRISQIPTLWTIVRRAHSDQSIESRSAQEQMIERYGGAIRRYLLGALRDQAAADDVYQEFVVRFLRGDYRSADPSKGRFRTFLKTILYRLVAEYYRDLKRAGKLKQLASNFPEPTLPSDSDSEELFQQSWRDELLRRTWAGLQAIEEETSRPFHTVMRAKVDDPQASSSELAAKLTEQLGKSVSISNARVMLHRARGEFAKLMVQKIADTIDGATRESIEDELVTLGLLEYCRPALERMKSS